ncbi:recombinase family protein [Bacillus sp. WLY-B-L8]|uniref:recombinase family protein n=1 Tax=Bacillus multifaciens TaxID=3068506 RepID=UPI002741C9CD|nr:recombinase family protein [Bacillus sp. WLY-B-L8]MDP7980999.1 recombinase family protein [Bacillus sp. WLY-B-L8]
MKCAIYRRVSTDMQAEKGFSLEAQKMRLEAYAQSQGWDIVGDYMDDGYSAKDMNRPELQRLLTDMKEKRFDVILVYKLDRLCRSVRDLNDMIEDFEKYHVKFKSSSEALDTTTATGRMMINMIGTLAQWEREQTAERVTENMYKRAELGLFNGGVIPFGYIKTNDSIIVNEDESVIIKEMFELALSNGFLAVSLKLNEKGYKTRSGHKWHKEAVKRILTNPIYCGYKRYGVKGNDSKEVVISKFNAKGFKPIISKEMFDECQKIFENRKTNAPKPRYGEYNYFSGIFVCPNCGQRLSAVTYMIKGKKYKYYKCAKKAQGFCNGYNVSLETLETAFLKTLNLTLDNIEINISDKIDINSIKKELDNLTKKKERVKNLYLDNVIDRDEMKERIDIINEKEKELYTLLSEEEETISVEVVKETLENLIYNWNIISDETKMYAIRSIFDSIEFKEISKANGRWKKAAIEITGYKLR